MHRQRRTVIHTVGCISHWQRARVPVRTGVCSCHSQVPIKLVKSRLRLYIKKSSRTAGHAYTPPPTSWPALRSCNSQRCRRGSLRRQRMQEDNDPRSNIEVAIVSNLLKFTYPRSSDLQLEALSGMLNETKSHRLLNYTL